MRIILINFYYSFGLVNLSLEKRLVFSNLNKNKEVNNMNSNSITGQALNLISLLPVVNNALERKESNDQKNARFGTEGKIQELISSGQLDSDTVQGALREKRYRIIDDKLENKFMCHRRRYPSLFTTFVSHTTEKPKTIATIESILPKIGIFNRPSITMTDLGYGDGDFTAELAMRIRRNMTDMSSLEVTGLENQQRFVTESKTRFAEHPALRDIKEDFRFGNFRDEEIPDYLKDRADVVVASHICFLFRDKNDFTKRMVSLSRENGLGILVHEKSSAINDFIKPHAELLRPRTADDINQKIEGSLRECQLPYVSETFDHEVIFPRLTEADWEKLKNVSELAFEATYDHESADWNTAKKLCEFFMQDPLESFTQENRTVLLDGFRAMLEENDHLVKMKDQIFFVGLKGSQAIDQLK
jgi:hypothetical protein